MPQNESNYISLQEATKFCNYSQEYLSLRARRGKLKSVKFGRSWVTKREWLEEYLKKVEDYNNQIALKNLKRVEPPEELEKVIEPLLRPMPKMRLAFSLALVFVLVIGGIVFGQESFKNVFETLDPYVTKISEISDLAAKDIWQDTKDFYKGVGLATSKIGRDFKEGLAISVDNTISYGAGQAAEVGGLLKGYFQWLSQNYSAANEFVEEKISNIARNVLVTSKGVVLGVKEGYFAANDFVEKKLSQSWQAVTRPREAPPTEKPLTEKTFVETQERLTDKLIQAFQKGFKELREEGVPVKETIKEVEKITKVEPIKEITKEVIKIDDKELAKLKTKITEIQEWEKDIKTLQALTQKLQPHPAYISVPTAPVYIATQGLQVEGAGIFASLGVTGSAGVGSLGVGGSTVLGSNLADALTVNATANFISPVTVQNTLKVGGVDHYLSVDTNGNLTVTGTITAATFASAADDSTVRKSGEEVLRGSVSIFRFDMPAQQTNTTTYYRISKFFSDNPLSTTTMPKLPGADRIFRLAISYADDLATTSSSTWRIYQTSPSATTCTFYLTGQNCTSTNPNCLSLEEGKPYLTSKKFISGTSCYIPDSNWQVELKLPDETKKIRIFNIFLLAYDRIK